jgi:glycosyltransferase involved in cell wall biosynthesis
MRSVGDGVRRHWQGRQSPIPSVKAGGISRDCAVLPDTHKLSQFRIVWYRTGPLGSFGGAERVLLEGLRCFREMGVCTTLLLHEPLSSKTGTFFAAHHPEIEVIPGFALGESGSRWIDLPGVFVQRIQNLRRTIKALAPNLIVANGPAECRFLWLYSLAGRIPLPPIVTFIHGSPFQFADDPTKYALVFRRHFSGIRAADPVYRDVIPDRSPAMELQERVKLEFECAVFRAGVRMSRLLFVLSHKNREEVERLYQVRNVEVACPGGYSRDHLHGGTEDRSPTFLPEITRPIFFSVCRLIAKKRVDLLIRAFRAFLDRNPHSTATLVIGGEGPEEASLRELARTFCPTGRVRFVGFIADSQLRKWYGASEIFLNADNADYDLSVMTSLPEGKKIVISTQYEVPLELSSLRRFFFVAPPNPDGYAETIARALATSVPPLGARDRPELESMTWENYFRHVLDRSRRAILDGAQ